MSYLRIFSTSTPKRCQIRNNYATGCPVQAEQTFWCLPAFGMVAKTTCSSKWKDNFVFTQTVCRPLGTWGSRSHLITSLRGFKKKNGWHLLENYEGNIHHCETFAQFDASFWDLCTYYTPLPVFYHIWKNYKIGLQEKWGRGFRKEKWRTRNTSVSLHVCQI